jgi:O-antigen/teichoic acid export membrane protein
VRLERERIGPGRIARYTFPLVGKSFLGQIIWRQSEALIVGYYFGPVLAGYFHLGYNFPQRILEFIPLALWPLVLAGLSEVQSRKEEELPRAIGLYYRVLFLLVIPVAAFGLTLGDKVIMVLYGGEMAQAGVLCRLFFAVFVIAFLGTPLHMATYVVEKTWANLAVGAAGAAVTLGLDLILIPRYGLYGGVPPTALGLVISNYLQYRIAKRYVPGLRIPWGHLGRVLAASCSIVLVYPLRPWVGGPVGLACACAGCCILFTAAGRLLKVLGDEEREVLMASNWGALRLAARVLSRR